MSGATDPLASDADADVCDVCDVGDVGDVGDDEDDDDDDDDDDDQAFRNEDGFILSELQARARARDEVLIAALASGAAYSEAARQAGCGVRTVARCMRDDSFRRSVADGRELWVTRTAGSLTALGPDAVAVLAEVMQDEATRYRLAAAQTVLTQGLRTRQHHELEAEVREIRAELNRLRNGVQS